MNRDILKILLGGLLILLLGILGIYIFLKGDQISGWIKQRQGSPVEENSSKEREIVSMDKVPNGGGEFPSNQNFDSEPKNKELPSEPSSQPLPKTDYEMPGLGQEKKESKSVRNSEKSETKETTTGSDSSIRQREELPEPRARVKEDKIEYDDIPKYKKTKSSRKSKLYKSKKRRSSDARLNSLERRVVRLEKKLGMKSTKTAPSKKKKLPLSKRVEILEKEVSGLKKKRQTE
ncbi:hypothetical protein [Leptospira wolffii]|uniref:hypothetical protein n=1 Tax=Leptospira wolffii TaxID=409998 RepID=UPI0013FD8A9A|nr:hypothetical protein [Leptospira wolffii]